MWVHKGEHKPIRPTSYSEFNTHGKAVAKSRQGNLPSIAATSVAVQSTQHSTQQETITRDSQNIISDTMITGTR